MKILTQISLLVIGALLFTTSSYAKKDVSGSKDHPLIQRYAGSHIVNYHYTDFDEYLLATGPRKNRSNAPTKKVSGQIYSIIYKSADNTESVAKVYRNFQLAFQNAGVKSIYACANKECGQRLVKQVIGDTHRKAVYLKMDPWNVGNSSDYRYWNGVLKKSDKNVYVNLIVEAKTFGKYPVTITLDIVEEEAMETGLVKLNPDYLKNSLQNEGRVILSGINFELDKAKLRPESNDALKIIAEYLNQNPKQNVYIVGHTDNQGKYEHNKSLSENRAFAVIQALKEKFKIKGKRLKAIGVADVSPVASNKVDNGRAKNRRVEMVSR